MLAVHKANSVDQVFHNSHDKNFVSLRSIVIDSKQQKGPGGPIYASEGWSFSAIKHCSA